VTTVIAHRGASKAAPENTIAAFELAGRLGADAVELDVRRTRDGALVVHHNPDLADGRVIRDVLAADLPSSVAAHRAWPSPQVVAVELVRERAGASTWHQPAGWRSVLAPAPDDQPRSAGARGAVGERLVARRTAAERAAQPPQRAGHGGSPFIVRNVTATSPGRAWPPG
jgi:glycerophosphoryl diester phosphodiesterase